jgi:hypothetical protein
MGERACGEEFRVRQYSGKRKNLYQRDLSRACHLSDQSDFGDG